MGLSCCQLSCIAHIALRNPRSFPHPLEVLLNPTPFLLALFEIEEEDGPEPTDSERDAGLDESLEDQPDELPDEPDEPPSISPRKKRGRKKISFDESSVHAYCPSKKPRSNPTPLADKTPGSRYVLIRPGEHSFMVTYCIFEISRSPLFVFYYYVSRSQFGDSGEYIFRVVQGAIHTKIHTTSITIHQGYYSLVPRRQQCHISASSKSLALIVTTRKLPLRQHLRRDRQNPHSLAITQRARGVGRW